MDAADFAQAEWRKSSHSNGGGECVEVAQTSLATAIRDSKNPFGSILTFPATAFAHFLAQR